MVVSAAVTDAAAPGSTPWTYTVNNADLDFLKAGETITLTYTLTATDTGAVLTPDHETGFYTDEAGKTREQVAVWAKKELEEAGGKVLGVVLNKRKYYIPEWIYKWL